MTRRGFLKVAGWSSLLTLGGLGAVVRGLQLGQLIYGRNGTIWLVARNDSGKTLDPLRIVSRKGTSITGYGNGKDRYPCQYGATMERVSPGELTIVVAEGYANVRRA